MGNKELEYKWLNLRRVVIRIRAGARARRGYLHRAAVLFAQLLQLLLTHLIELAGVAFELERNDAELAIESVLLHLEILIEATLLHDEHVVCFLCGLCGAEHGRVRERKIFVLFARVDHQRDVHVLARGEAPERLCDNV